MSSHFSSAVDLTQRLANGDLRAEQVMEDTLARIGAINPKVNALVGMASPDDLLAQARAADQSAPCGPLHGLPIAVKDLVEVAGLRSTHGSPVYADHVPKADHLLAARLREAGAILIGKTNVPEFGLGSHTFNPVYGATRNPYAPDLSCGGSSGGAAVALATGMTALADGSDMMGSLRNPAAWNNVYGLRPSWGAVPSEPVGDAFLHQMATLGPMARSPQDIALLLDVLAGPDPRQPLNAAYAPVGTLDPAQMQGKRIGWLGDWGGAFPTEPGILTLCETALAVFQDLGCVVEPVAPPMESEPLWQAWVALRAYQVASGLEPLLAQPDLLKDTAKWEIETGLSLSAMDVHRASVTRSDWFRRAAALFDTYDALVLPGAQVWPFALDLDWPRQINGVAMDTYHRWMQVMVPASLIGVPALAIPAGFGDTGLPMGVQVIGPRGGDADLLRLGAAYHAATHWPQLRPAMSDGQG